MHALIRSRGFGTLVTAGPDGPDANHVPFYLDASGKLQCHVARSNPLWEQVRQSPQVLVIFHGPDAYISPNWYATKKETGKAVPTWNYQVVHAHGRAEPIEDPAWLREHLDNLTHHNEHMRPDAWAVSDAPADYIEKMMGAIVGLEITLDRLEGKLKASQNQPEANRAGVKAGLDAEGTESANAMGNHVP
ncbi:FMN-binding negative transcriptional regulator [Marinobacter fonticola]|uniref:FMN-binding negative transcriptional regulator n=1 Tax=Marinobacter fonticola TaxID=2603215 RepID=UPI0022288602|nr:FMN-binding negative transcriptional regulator [Marinobacter fonticola]